MGSENTAPSEERGNNFEWANHLFKEHEAFIRSVIGFAIQNPSETDDFFQELYLYFVRKPPLEEIRNLKGFLYRVIIDRAKDWHRRQSRRQQKRYQLVHQIRQEQTDERAESDFFQREEARELFHQIERHLQENEAKAILYRYKHDYTLDETAREMGLQPKTISRYVSVGLKKIRELLKDKERAE